MMPWTDADTDLVKSGLDAIDPRKPPPAAAAGFSLNALDWAAFSRSSEGDGPPCLVDGLIPEHSLVFIAAQPKNGKTWLACSLALCVASGEPYLGRTVPQARPVLYVALEGDRSALAARLAGLARGLGLDPTEQINGLHVSFKPPGLDLADEQHIAAIEADVARLGAGLVVIDVLRNAATIPESGEGAVVFGAIRRNIDRMRAAGAAVALLHHNRKTSQESAAMPVHERMTGTGALGGAMDVGIFVTAASAGASVMQVATVARDLPEREPVEVRLTGERTGKFGGWSRHDTIRVECTSAEPPTPSKLDELVSIVGERGWASPGDLRERAKLGESALRNRRNALELRGVFYIAADRWSVYVASPDRASAEALAAAGFQGAQASTEDATPTPRHPAIDPAPATPRYPAPSEARGTKPPQTLGNSTPRPADPAIEGRGVAESADLQELPDPATPRPLRGRTAPPTAAVPPDATAEEEEQLARARLLIEEETP